MALMTWTDQFSVGVTEMDDQHKQLMNAVNDLHAAMMNGAAKEQTGPLLQTLVRYTREHFAAEESLMRRLRFSGVAEHATKHKELTAQVEAFAHRFERGEMALDVHLLKFLCDWLRTHIQKEDKTYGACLSAN